MNTSKVIVALIVCLTCSIPSFAVAADGAVQFAGDSVFLSRQSITAGDSVLVYASVVNRSATVFNGNVVYKDAGVEMGRVAVSLAVGEARVVSVSWQPKSGSHTVTAELVDASDKSLSSTGNAGAQAAAIFVVDAPAPSPSAQSASVADSLNSANPQSALSSLASLSASTLLGDIGSNGPIQTSQDIDDFIAAALPSASSTASTALGAIDSARQSVIGVIDSQAATAKTHLPTSKPATTSPKEPAGLTMQSIIGWCVSVLWTLWFYALVVAHNVIASVALFYPLLVALFVWALYAAYRRMTRPKYEY